MYSFKTQAAKIIEAGKGYGVAIGLTANEKHGKLSFTGECKSSQSVREYLERRMSTYNKHSEQGF